MRKRYRVLLLAVIVAAVAVPVGFALSLESEPAVVYTHTPTVVATATTAAMPTLVHSESPGDLLKPMHDGAKLLIVGTMLFGLAAAVRRAA